MTPFGQSVQAALDARKSAQASGPRTMRDLARAIKCDPGNLHHFLRGTKPIPAATEQAIRAALSELNKCDAVFQFKHEGITRVCYLTRGHDGNHVGGPAGAALPELQEKA